MSNGNERYVFGSLVNGDFDKGSDVDILIITNIIGSDTFPANWSVYTEKRIIELYKKGTLFSWHLYNDAIPVSILARKNDFLRKIGRPNDYKSAFTEIEYLSQLLKVSLEELSTRSPSVVYELGLIALGIRDIGMAASMSLTGSFNFSKYAPTELGDFSIPMDRCFYDSLIECRRATIRGGRVLDVQQLKFDVLNNKEKLAIWVANIKKAVQGDMM
jgi:predicted nucleotidyltransferase